ncbi:metallophosphoesterase family protein [Alkalicoccus daliensis]|uniref:Predicted phosphodiesterase n=1 Tax=Alkalicoccus daliensis TaxID=745820 RepID=A0A1H0ARB1_9BACI|nr:metallophosphoesterase family protein [Alkalicoccus daliensis]SDN35921.1 Predicted phosphodiesterase [Alkalicoccus daliensis]
MKLAVFSDVHGNEAALQAVLEDMEAQNVTDVLMLGDISYRGPKPKECLDLVRSRADKIVKGNADAWAVRGIKEGEVPPAALEMMQAEQIFTSSLLSTEDLRFLDELPATLEIPLTNKRQLFACHATPSSLFDVITDESKNEEFSTFIDADPRAEFFTYGHIHLSHFRHIDGRKIFNPGSVGLPFDGDPRASYTILTRENDIHMQFRRVAYDTERAVRDLHETGYPEAAVSLLTHIYRYGKRP